METEEKITITKKKWFNHFSIGNLSTIISVVFLLTGAYVSYNARERDKAIIEHDRDQKLDSVVVVLGIVHAKQEESAANTITRIRQRDKEKDEVDKATTEMKIEIARTQQRLEDFIEFYNHKK